MRKKDAKALRMALDPYQIWQPNAHIRTRTYFNTFPEEGQEPNGLGVFTRGS